jgi:carbon monoxide dehydrogenase subunit G
MATLRKEVVVDAPAERVWDAVRDVGALHTRLVPGFVLDTRLEGEVRVVTFDNGMVVREPIVSVDDVRRRMAWTATGGRTTHYNAALEVLPEGAGCRVVWIIDLLPHELSAAIGAMQDRGLAAIKRTFEADRSGPRR